MSPNRAIEREDGFTLIELMITAAIMSIVSTAVIAMAMRTVDTSATIVDRRDVLAEGRIALDRLGKQIRQAESVDTTYSTATQIKVGDLHRRHADDRRLAGAAGARRRSSSRSRGTAVRRSRRWRPR